MKVEVIAVLANLVKSGDLGDLQSDRTRVSVPQADLSAEPDVLFISAAALESGRVRLVSKTTGEAGRYVEVEGASPDLVVEIVSDRSVTKDTVRLPDAYWRAGVLEYWLMDARGEELLFRIHHSGPSGYVPVGVDAEGFQSSGVFDRRFRVDVQAGPARRMDLRPGTRGTLVSCRDRHDRAAALLHVESAAGK